MLSIKLSSIERFLPEDRHLRSAHMQTWALSRSGATELMEVRDGAGQSEWNGAPGIGR
jgi:hypothetical protein